MRIPNINNYIKINKFICGVHGYWPVRHRRWIFNISDVEFRLVITFIAVNYLFLPQVMALYKYRKDVHMLTSIGCVLTTLVQLVFKMIYLLTRRNTVYEVYNRIMFFWSCTSDSEERNLLMKLAQQSKIFTISFLITGMNVVVIFSVRAATYWLQRDILKDEDAEKILPFEAWYGFEVIGSEYYATAFLLQIISAFVCNNLIIGLDATLMTMILHVCGQFGLLQERFRKIELLADQTSTKSNFLVVNMEIKQIIRHHNMVVECVDNINSLVRPVIFIQLLTSALEICLSGFAIIVTGTSTIDLIRFTIYLNCMIVQLVVWCWPGEVLVEQSLSLSDTIFYEIEWQKLPLKMRKNFNYIIMRTMKPCCISSFGMEVIRIRKLAEIFRAAGSFFTMLRNVYSN